AWPNVGHTVLGTALPDGRRCSLGAMSAREVAVEDEDVEEEDVEEDDVDGNDRQPTAAAIVATTTSNRAIWIPRLRALLVATRRASLWPMPCSQRRGLLRDRIKISICRRYAPT